MMIRLGSPSYSVGPIRWISVSINPTCDRASRGQRSPLESAVPHPPRMCGVAPPDPLQPCSRSHRARGAAPPLFDQRCGVAGAAHRLFGTEGNGWKRGQKFGKDDGQIDQDGHRAAQHGQAMFAKLAPHERPLGRDQDLGFRIWLCRAQDQPVRPVLDLSCDRQRSDEPRWS